MKPKLHLRRGTVGAAPACGSRASDVLLTDDTERVTCQSCRRSVSSALEATGDESMNWQAFSRGDEPPDGPVVITDEAGRIRIARAVLTQIGSPAYLAVYWDAVRRRVGQANAPAHGAVRFKVRYPACGTLPFITCPTAFAAFGVEPAAAQYSPAIEDGMVVFGPVGAPAEPSVPVEPVVTAFDPAKAREVARLNLARR